MLFVEKDITRDPAARTYRVFGTPSFVLVDANGKELARFGYQRSAAEFAATVKAALAKARGG